MIIRPGRSASSRPGAPQAKVVDLMDAVRRSLGADKPARGAPAEVRKLPAKQKAKESAGGKPAPRRRKAG